MRRSWLTTTLLIILFGAFFGTAVRIQHEGVTRIKGNPPFYETWQLRGDRSSEMLKVMSLRYDQFVADLLWLRAIQSFGGRGMTNRDWKPLYNMFDTITDLDPYFEPAYTFGNMVIGDEGGKQREGLQLLHKGTFKIFKGYRIPFEGMYVAHWMMGDSDTARWYGRIAAKRMDAPEWVDRITAYIDVKSGEYYIGFDRFLGNLLRSLDDDQGPMQAIAVSKLLETVGKWNHSLMTRALDEYTSRTGSSPNRIEQLASMPALQEYETVSIPKVIEAVEIRARSLAKDGLNPDYLNEAPYLLSVLQAAQMGATPETTATSMVQQQNDIFSEVLRTSSGIPEDPYGEKYHLNLTLLNDPEVTPEDKILRTSELEEYLKTDLLGNIRTYIQERKEMLGRNPRDLQEVFYTEFKTPEPFGGEWIYNPETAEFKSTSRPDY